MQGGKNIPGLQMDQLPGLGGKVITVDDRQCRAGCPALAFADLIDIKIVHDGEQPLARALAVPPLMKPGKGPYDAILDKIVGLIGIAKERPGITSEMRDFPGNRLGAIQPPAPI